MKIILSGLCLIATTLIVKRILVYFGQKSGIREKSGGFEKRPRKYFYI